MPDVRLSIYLAPPKGKTMNGKKAKALRRAGLRGGPAPRVPSPLRQTVCGCGRKITVNVGEDGTVNRRQCGQCGPTGMTRTQIKALTDAMRHGRREEAQRLAGIPAMPERIVCAECAGSGDGEHDDGDECTVCGGAGTIPNPAQYEQPV